MRAKIKSADFNTSIGERQGSADLIGERAGRIGLVTSAKPARPNRPGRIHKIGPPPSIPLISTLVVAPLVGHADQWISGLRR